MAISKIEPGNLILEIIPDVGVKPILFGMKSDQVRNILGQQPYRVNNVPAADTKVEERYHDFIGVHYDMKDEVYSVVVAPGTITVLFNNYELIGANAVDNPLRILLLSDPNPMEYVGYIIFDKLGIAATGYHDYDESQQAITVYRKGALDISKAKPISSEWLL